MFEKELNHRIDVRGMLERRKRHQRTRWCRRQILGDQKLKISIYNQIIFDRKWLSTALILVMTVLLLASCGGKQLKVEPISKSENPGDLVNQLGSELKNSQENQVDILSPGWFAKAKSSFQEASKKLEAGDEISEILLNISYGRAQLHRAEELALLSRTVLRDVIEARNDALAAGADNLGRDYNRVEEQFLEITGAIEENNLDWADRKKESVHRAYRQLELQAIKERHLGEARKLILQAENEGAKKIAPKALALAQSTLREADAYISEHRYEIEKVQKRGEDASFEARRLLNVTRESRSSRPCNLRDLPLGGEAYLQDNQKTFGTRHAR